MRLRPTWVEIDVAALKKNLRWLKARNGAAFFCPMVKANAYGHGDVLVSKEADQVGVDALGVALIEEGVHLRRHQISSPILVFASFETASAKSMFEYNLTPVIGRLADLEALSESPPGYPVHLKFNTGMQRLGLDEQDLAPLKAWLKTSSVKVVGVCTHLSHGEEASDPAGPSAKQIARLNVIAREFAGARLHANKTASLITNPVLEIGARPGIGMHGVAYDDTPLPTELAPTLSWHTQITHLHKLATNEAAGYGGAWIAPRPSIIGVVPVGYADGYTRILGGRSHMLWRGRNVPVIGRVCMDYTLLDLTAAAAADGGEPPQTGERVVIIGRQNENQVSALELADKASTIPYEILTGISTRVPREAV